MTTVHLTQGLPGSGKSTLARSLGVLRFSLDDFRAMMGTGKDSWTNEREQVTKNAMMASARAAILAGHDVCMDNTHVVPNLPRRYRKEFAPLGVTFKVHSLMDVSINDCITNDMKRAESVGESVIRLLADRYAEAAKYGWRLTDEWMNLDQYVPPVPYAARPDLPGIVICDIDGTVAVHGPERGHYEYDKVAGDRPNEGVVTMVQSLIYDVVFMSGREDRCRPETEEWLWRYDLSNGNPALHMRTTGDHRPDYIIKSELFDKHIRDQYNVLFVLDDRDQVVRLWRDMGLTCLQVADGDF